MWSHRPRSDTKRPPGDRRCEPSDAKCGNPWSNLLVSGVPYDCAALDSRSREFSCGDATPCWVFKKENPIPCGPTRARTPATQRPKRTPIFQTVRTRILTFGPTAPMPPAVVEWEAVRSTTLLRTGREARMAHPRTPAPMELSHPVPRIPAKTEAPAHRAWAGIGAIARERDSQERTERCPDFSRWRSCSTRGRRRPERISLDEGVRHATSVDPWCR
jgi:hypothetical protein